MGGVATPGFRFVRTPLRLRVALQHAPRLLGIAAAIIAATILLGWIAGIEAITHPPGFRQMSPGSALMSLLAGLALSLGLDRRAGLVCAVALCVVAVIGLVDSLPRVEILSDRIHGPAWQSSVAFLLIGAAQLGIARRTRTRDHLAISLTLAAMLFAGLSLLGYVFGARALYGEAEVEPYINTSPPSALLVFVVGLGILARQTDRGVFSIVVAEDAGGVAARRLLAGLALFLPIALFVVLGARLGWYALAFAAALVLFLTLTLGSASILATARRLGRAASTERAAVAEAAGAESRRRVWLQTIVDQIPEGVMVRDADEAIDLINRSLARWQVDDGPLDETGHPRLFDVRDPKRRSTRFVDLPLIRALRSGKPTSEEELVLRLRDGSFLPVAVRATPIRDSEGHTLGSVGIVRDISEHKELQRLRDEWIAIIAHDLRQPIGAIRLAADLMLEGDRSPEDRRMLGQIASSANRVERMISDLLDAARVTADQLSLHRSVVDVVPLLRAILEQSRQDDPSLEIRLATPEHETAWIDPERIQQVLGNLMSNAVKYRTPNTPVSVEVVRVENMVRVCVCNEGPEIAPDELHELFGRFRRTRDAKSSAKPGIGLGLYICKGIIDAHGGDIWVGAERGMIRFCFTVPVSPG